MRRRLKYVALRSQLHQVAGIHHRHPVGDLRNHGQVVRNKQHGQAKLGPQFSQQFKNLRLNGDIERGRGLVGDQQLGRLTIAMAIITRCRMPPESWCG